jgi:hypothetical protein
MAETAKKAVPGTRRIESGAAKAERDVRYERLVQAENIMALD